MDYVLPMTDGRTVRRLAPLRESCRRSRRKEQGRSRPAKGVAIMIWICHMVELSKMTQQLARRLAEAIGRGADAALRQAAESSEVDPAEGNEALVPTGIGGADHSRRSQAA
jgi:hypothetical protein